jgi:hypothetical protein
MALIAWAKLLATATRISSPVAALVIDRPSNIPISLSGPLMQKGFNVASSNVLAAVNIPQWRWMWVMRRRNAHDSFYCRQRRNIAFGKHQTNAFLSVLL